MKYLSQFFVISSLFFFLIACSNDDNGNNGSIQEAVLDTETAIELTDVAYANDSPRQVFDIYLPANRTTQTKTMILIHGGSWVSGDKSSMDFFKNAIIEEFSNLAIVSMNYRYAGLNNPPYPMQTDDISSMVNFLKENKESYTISDKIGFIGTSAGGHLSLLWSYALDSENQVDMVCSIVGPTNLTDENYLNSSSGEIQVLVQLFTGGILDLEFLMEASPLHRVTSSAPPTILFYGGQDPLVPTSQGIDLSNRLEELGVTHEFTLYPDEGHGWDGENGMDTLEKLNNFIAEHL